MPMTLDVLREAARLAERGERVGLATIVATRGSTPQKVGARLLARDDRRLAGTLGGGAVEAEVIREATRAAAGGPSVVREYTLSTGEDEWGLACGGTMVVFVERLDGRALDWLKPVVEAAEGRDPVAVVAVVDGEESGARLVVREREVAGVLPDAALTAAGVKLGRRVLQEEAAALEAVTGGRLYAELFGPPPALVIVGAGHVGKALAALAHGLGVPVTVVDDRPEYASRERFPEADRVVAAPVGEALGWLPIGRRTGVVVAMRNQDLDYEATDGAPDLRRIPDRARARPPGAHRARHRRPRAGGDRGLDHGRMAHGPAGRHGERPAAGRAALREGRRARRDHVSLVGPGAPSSRRWGRYRFRSETGWPT
jgi:xanthine dehydrogenase accessory factor